MQVLFFPLMRFLNIPHQNVLPHFFPIIIFISASPKHIPTRGQENKRPSFIIARANSAFRPTFHHLQIFKSEK